MSLQSRIIRLERTQTDPTSPALLKPSEILKRADELLQLGAIPTDEQRAALESIKTVTHE